jgi:ketosteroid isomerase-like protein
MQIGSQVAALLFLAFGTLAAAPPVASTFAPFEAWKASVVAGDAAALAKLYSTSPEAFTQVGKMRIALKTEETYWSSLKSSGMTEFTPRVLEVGDVKGNMRIVLRISTASGSTRLYAGMQQVWARQTDGWKMVASARDDFSVEATRRLPQPAAPNVNLYSDPREAEQELKAGLARAGKEHKRVIVVFGGNWCYDCHVLDTTFHSKEFAPLVEANYVVVHINVGDEGKDNAALGARLGVALDKGVPSLGVLEADGKVIYAQRNGEFESTVKIGPDDVRAFLEKWKRKS